MRRAVLICWFILLCNWLNAQQFTGVSLTPTAFNLRLKNYQYEHNSLFTNGLIIRGFYQKAEYDFSKYDYKIRAHVFGINVGRYTTYVYRKHRHYAGFLFGIMASTNDYSFQNSFTDLLGTTYSEKKQASRWEGGVSIHYFYLLPLYKHLHLMGKVGLLFTPQNISHPLDNSYEKFTDLPFYTLIGGPFPLFNLDLQIGFFYQWDFKRQTD